MFDGAFEYNDGKEIRIPMSEDGIDIQIKVALTCAKDNVAPGDDVALPGETKTTVELVNTQNETPSAPIEASAEEKQTIADLLASIGL